MTIDDDCSLLQEHLHTERFSGVERLNEASKWLVATGGHSFPGQSLFLFYSDSAPQGNNRISRYRGIKKRSGLLHIFSEMDSVFEDGVEEFDDGLWFWALVSVQQESLVAIINRLREDRSSFLFFSRSSPTYSQVLKNILRGRGLGRNADIDRPWVLSALIRDGLNPVRVWSPTGDPELWLEIYGPRSLLRVV